MSLVATEYNPRIPYQDSSSCHCACDKKMALLIAAVIFTALIVFGSLTLTKQIPFLIEHYASWQSIFTIVVGGFGAEVCLLAFCILKGQYNELYPKGNFLNFLRRDWNDFTGENYEHFEAWKKAHSTS